jgi:hypothetical protein
MSLRRLSKMAYNEPSVGDSFIYDLNKKKMIKTLKKLFGKKPIESTQEVNKISSNTMLADEVCYHRTQDRVRTHRGHHCNNCGKRF